MQIRSLLKFVGVSVLTVSCTVFASLYWVTKEGERTTEAQRASQELGRTIGSLINLTQEFTLYGGERAAMQWHARHKILLQVVDEVQKQDSPPAQDILRLRSKAEELGKLFARYEEVVATHTSEQDPQRRILLQELLVVEAQELVEARYVWAQRVVNEDVSQQQLLSHAVLAGIVGMLLLTGVAGWLVHRRLLVPLKHLEMATADMSVGDMSRRPVMTEQDELGKAGRAIYSMVDQLKDLKDRLQLIIDSVPALISHIDLSQCYTMVNKAYLEWDGRGLPDLVGHSVEDVHGTEGFTMLKGKLDEAFNGHAVAFEVELKRGGTYHAMSVAYVPSRSVAGQVDGVYALKTDVTSVRRAEEHLRLVMETSPIGMFTTDVVGNCTYSNPALHKITGISLEDSLGFGLRQGVHPDDLHRIIAIRAAVLAAPCVQTSEHRFVHPDGSIVWVRANITSLWHNGVAEMVIGTMEDITERRALDQLLADKSLALERSNEDLERFAYVASHDLQEPLRMVNSYGQLLLHRHAGALNDEAKEFLAFMVDGGHRAQALVRDLLSLARLDSQSKPFASVSLEAVVTRSLHSLRDVVKTSGATISPSKLPVVMGDAGQLEQLFTNLISNALKFKGADTPKVTISAHREADSWIVSVKDNGIGIEPRFYERIFVMFQRLHLRSEHPGTGIGLAICKRVVERHGGRIWVESEPNHGSEFIFSIPAILETNDAKDGQLVAGNSASERR